MKVMRRLIGEIRLVKGLFLLALVLFLAGLVSGQLSPFLLQGIIDGSLTRFGQGNGSGQAVFLRELAVYFLVVLLGALLQYASSRVLTHCANRISENLRNRAYDTMQNLPISYFDDKPAGKIATRIVNDTETLRTQFYGNIIAIFIDVAKILFTYGILFYLNLGLGLGLMVLWPAFYGLQVWYSRLTDQPIKDFYEARSEVNTQVNETMHGASLIQVYGREDLMREEFDQSASKMRDANVRILWANSVASWPLTELVKNGIVTLILTVVVYQFLAGETVLTAGCLFLYLHYVITIFDLMGGLVRKFPNVQRSMETGKRVLDLLEQEVETDGNREIKVTTGLVRFEKVSFAYEEGKAVLHEIDFQAAKGQTLALVGHTGSGKSSIMNLLYRFYEPQEGRILVDHQDISQYSRESLRASMGIVLQDPYLFTGTIASNVAMGQEEMDRQGVLSALEKVGAGDFIARLDKGIDEPVVEKGATFSSGERQLIAFARTLYANPSILILDEATSHIDTETEELIQKAMEVVKEGRTTFIIAHRLSTIQTADEILVLEEGRIVERGDHETLLARNGSYAHMHQIQQKV